MKKSDNVEIIYCDNHLLVANKPPCLLTRPDETGQESLEGLAKQWVKREFQKQGSVFLHAIHRLDKPVSGLVLFARTSKALSRLNEQSRSMEIQRGYLAEVEGILPVTEGRLDHYLVHGNHKAVVVKEDHKEAKHARLVYQVQRILPHSSVVSIDLETGRYHQIRAQFAAIGHPIVGDGRYGAKNETENIHLHCQKMEFKHPVTQEVLRFESSPPFFQQSGQR